MARKGTQNTPTKICTKTGVEYPMTPEYFYRDKSSKDGFSPWSKNAEKAYNRAYYAGLKNAKVTRKGDINGLKNARAKNAATKAFEGEMASERVKRGTHTNRKKAVTNSPAPAPRARAKSATKGKGNTRKAA
jgi:hypothetical protein